MLGVGRVARAANAAAAHQVRQRWLSGAAAAAASKDGPVFDKILIANRGEIACRVMRSAHDMGIKTVAIYSEPDAEAMHVKMADEAYCVGPAASAESYLNIDRIMEVIDATGAQAVHPGYGFLSENHLFAEALEAKGVQFIGPKSFAIISMGDKIQSKKLAAEAGVHTIPGSLALVSTDEEITTIAGEIGYPVMIKASAGGGGKGMRIAWNDAEALEGYKLSKTEAIKSFGDDRIFIEKFVEEPRHIEIQLIADSFGNVAALPERECSIQRRNQKVLEESPSMCLDEKTRSAMQEQAIQMAKAVDYQSAGTVEFLVDKHLNFFFLEMNTRLQVEHPVSEFVSGIDLVEEAIKVAAGQKLSPEILDKNRPILGWAHEARIYAEDPFRGFLPSTGRLVEYHQPGSADVPEVRVDTGVTQGSEISMHYDPMIAKLVTHGKTREEALDRLQVALDNYVIKGLSHNVNFCREVTRHPKFRSGKFTTKFIEEEYPEGFHGVQLEPAEKESLAALAAVLHIVRLEAVMSLSGQRVEPSMPDELYITVDVEGAAATAATANVEAAAPAGFIVRQAAATEEDAGDNTFEVLDMASREVLQLVDVGEVDCVPGQTLTHAELNGERNTVQCLERSAQGYRLQYCGAIVQVAVRSKLEEDMSRIMLPKVAVDYSKWLRSPMPGMLNSVAVEVGEHVFAGQELAVIEAMKMQNVLRAEKDGVVKAICAAPGTTLAVDEEIIEYEE